MDHSKLDERNKPVSGPLKLCLQRFDDARYQLKQLFESFEDRLSPKWDIARKREGCFESPFFVKCYRLYRS